MKKLSWLLVLGIPFVFSSCNSVISKDDLNQGKTPTIALAPAADTPAPTPTPVEYDFEVIFDGEQCSVIGLSELSVGYAVFSFTNTSGKAAYPYICRLDADKSWEDVVEYSGEPGSWRPEASWCKGQGGSVSGREVNSELYKIFLLEGEHVILCDQTEAPKGGWLGTGFWVR